MKRFVRYLYEYRNGKRVQNLGFVKVEESEDSAVIQIYGKGFPASGRQELEILLFYLEEKMCIGIPWGKVQKMRPMLSYHLEYDVRSLGSKERFQQIEGIVLRTTEEDRKYYAAIWKDNPIAIELIKLQEMHEKPEEIREEIPAEEVLAEEVFIEETEAGNQVYKITRKDLVNLPRQEWKLANNHFLVHGCRNFHHLVSFEKDGKCWLGVPGIYHKQEEQAARAFGFGAFMKPDEGDVELTEDEAADKEEFGYWCRPVHNVIKR